MAQALTTAFLFRRRTAWRFGITNSPGAECQSVHKTIATSIFITTRRRNGGDPDKQNFPYLAHHPFVTDIREAFRTGWSDLRIEGYVGGKLVITRLMSGKGVDRQLLVEPDDLELVGDGIEVSVQGMSLHVRAINRIGSSENGEKVKFFTAKTGRWIYLPILVWCSLYG